MKKKFALIVVAVLIVLANSFVILAETQPGNIDTLLASIEARIDLTSDQKVSLEKLIIEVVPADQSNLPVELVNQLITYQLNAKDGINLDELKEEVSGVVVATKAGIDLHIVQAKFIPDVAKSLQGIDPAVLNQLITQLNQLKANGAIKGGIEELAKLMVKAYQYNVDITAQLALINDYQVKGKDLEPILKQIRDKLADAKVTEKDAEKDAEKAAKNAEKAAKEASKATEKATKDAEKDKSENGKDQHKDNAKAKDGDQAKDSKSKK